MSESPLSDQPLPPDHALEHALRHAVQITYKNGDMAELTVKRIRAAAEKDLGLQDDFFKQGEWKIRSKEIISNEVDAISTSVPPSSQPQSVKSTPVRKAPTPRAQPTAIPPPKKRSSPDDTKAVKRRKLVHKAPSVDAASGNESLAESDTTPRKVAPKKPVARQTSPKKPDVGKQRQNGSERQTPPVDQGSESDMSEVLDEAPKTKARKRRSGSSEPKPKAAIKKKETSKPAKPQEVGPDAEEIKKLQGWLIKCGIRKMWFRELAPYDTAKAKIRHLREMLADAGMTGRYSIEKAEEIRVKRELAADLEAVQEGAKKWGSKEDVVNSPGRPRRRLVAKGLQSLDFLNDDDGEETD